MVILQQEPDGEMLNSEIAYKFSAFALKEGRGGVPVCVEI